MTPVRMSLIVSALFDGVKLVIPQGVRRKKVTRTACDRTLHAPASGGHMDFGTKLAFDGHATPPRDATLPIAWFERSSAERGSVHEKGAQDGYALLDRLREAGGLVYSGEEEA